MDGYQCRGAKKRVRALSSRSAYASFRRRCQKQLSGTSTKTTAVSSGNPGVITLLFALETQKVIVAATLLYGVFATGRRASRIDRAAPGLCVEEPADAAEVQVGLAPQTLFATMGFFRKARTGLFKGKAEVSRETVDVTLVDRNNWVRAAEAWAFCAVVAGHSRSVERKGTTRSYIEVGRGPANSWALFGNFGCFQAEHRNWSCSAPGPITGHRHWPRTWPAPREHG